jgi:hypothetical protein
MKNQHTCIFIAVRNPVIKRGVLTHHMFVSVPSQDLDFQPGADPGGGRTRRATPIEPHGPRYFYTFTLYTITLILSTKNVKCSINTYNHRKDLELY